MRLKGLAAIALGLTTVSSFAATPELLGSLEHEGLVVALSVSSNARLAAALVLDKDQYQGHLELVDLSAPAKPVIVANTPNLAATFDSQVALSSDGRRALIVTNQVKQPSYKARDWEVIGITFPSEPSQPQVIWHRTLQARTVTVAPDASAYASSEIADHDRAGSFDKWKVVVRYFSDSKPPIAFDDMVAGDVHLVLSQECAFLLQWGGGFTQLTDLNAAPTPTSLQRAPDLQPDWGRQLALTPSGAIVQATESGARVEVLAPKAGLPILSSSKTGLHGDSLDRFSLVQDADGPDLWLGASSVLGIVRINPATPGKPINNKTLLLPENIQLRASTSGLLLATAGTKIEVFDSRSLREAPFDWPGLLREYQQTLLEYKRTPKDPGGYSAARKAATRLQGLVASALQAPVSGISAKQAAAVFNDYGFWANRADAPNAQAALRRAIELDPSRIVAVLNLADVLRENVDKIDDRKERRRSINEIGALYKRYLAAGGKQKTEMAEYLEPAKYTKNDICEAIAHFSNVHRLKELMGSGRDLKVHGRSVDVEISYEGTAHVPVITWTDPKTGEQVDVGVAMGGEDDQLWGGDDLSIVVYGDDVHLLHSRGDEHPISTTPLEGNHSSCSFETSVEQSIGDHPAEPELCEKILASSYKGWDIEATPPIAFEKLAEPGGAPDFEATISASKTLDVLNDGKPILVQQLDIASGAGAGCDAVYFTTPNTEAAPLLDDMQGRKEGYRYPVPCGNAPQFFSWRGKVYYEDRTAHWPPEDAWDRYHRIARIQNGQATDVCGFNFKGSVKVAH